MIGRAVSHYRILGKLGAGGMGEVYKAEDTRLKRTVALKFLPPELIRDETAKQRFLHEAQAASSLDHPNICNVHDVGETDEGRIFIVMACYEGETLRDRIAGGPLPLPEALRIAAQTAEGMEQAHQRGIVHRDLKPANLFLTAAGLVKILDFGLAKLLGQSNLTRSGSTLGTVAYMSPEQGRGDAVDHRTDIWSLGVVLYEMVAGKAPFRGDYPQAVIYSILNEEPGLLSTERDDVPPELDRVVERALAKDPDERYPSMATFLVELRAAQRKIMAAGVGAEAPGTDTRSIHPPSRRAKRLPDTHPDRGIRKRSAARIQAARLAWFLLAAALIGGGILAFRWLRPGGDESRHTLLQGLPRQVTTGDNWQDEPVLSPDGTRIAYAAEVDGNRDIYLIDVRGGNPLRLTDDPAPDHSPSWFPDGTDLAFVSGRSGDQGIWKVSQLGGGALSLLPNAVDPVISPDGKQIACAISNSANEYRIGVAPLSDPGTVKILTGSEDGSWNHRQPAWSPDGRSICYSAHDELWLVPSGGGAARRLTLSGRADANPTWSSDGSYVYFSSERGGTLALWRISVEDGEATRMTLGSSYEHHPSLCRDGSRLVYATRVANNTLHIRDLESGRETELPVLRDYSFAALSPDGNRLVYASSRGGEHIDLWMQPLEKGQPSVPPQRLTDEAGIASCPVFSPDGRWISYYRIVEGQRDIYVIPAAGGRPNRFTDDLEADTHTAWSPDSSRLAFVSDRGGANRIWIAPIRNGRPSASPRALTKAGTNASPAWSPDGSRIAFVRCEERRSEVWIQPVDGAEPPRQLTTEAGALWIRWNARMGDLWVVGSWGGELLSLRRVSPEDGKTASLEPPVVLGSLESLGSFDVASGRPLLVYSKESTAGNIWILESRKGNY